MQFFKISIILFFSVDLLYFFIPRIFLSRLSTDLHQIWHESIFLHAIYTEESDFRKVQKPGDNGQKTSKNRLNFRTGRHVFARCDETVKFVWKIFTAMTSRLLYLSNNIYATVQNSLVFSNTWLNGASKRPTLMSIISQTIRDKPKFALSVNRKHMCAYRRHCLDLTPSDLEQRYRGGGVKFPTVVV